MIEKHLKDLLTQKGSVAVQGLGTFSLEYKKPVIDKGSKKISPPSKEVKFNWNPKEKDNGFIAFVAKQQKKKVADSTASVKKEVSDLLKTLDKSQKVEWKGLGVFSGDHNNVVFSSSGKNLHRSAAGQGQVKSAGVENKSLEAKPKVTATKKAEPSKPKEEAKPKVEEKPASAAKPKSEPSAAKKEEEKPVVTPVVAPKPQESKEEKKVESKAPPAAEKVGSEKKEEEKKGSMAWLWILLIIVLAGSAITLFIINREPAEEPKVVEVTPEPEPVKEEPVVEEEPPPPPPKVLTISKKTGRFYIIMGGFSNKDNAMKQRDEIEQKGASDAKVIFPYPPKNLYRVSIQDHDNLEEAVAAMRELRSEYGNYIWVLTY